MLPSKGLARFGSFDLDLASDELKKRGVATRLRGQPVKVLRLLLEQPGEVVTRQQLHETLWGEQTFVEFDVGLNAAVRRLRRALGDSADVPRYIETLPGRGYRFLAAVELTGAQPVTRVTAEPAAHPPLEGLAGPGGAGSAEGSGHGPEPNQAGRLSPWRRSGWIAAAAASALVLAVAFGWSTGWGGGSPPPGAPIRSVAVLPFQNLSSDEELGFFASGLADALLAQLGRIHELKVISRTSTLRYAGTTRSIPEIARELGVDALIEGSVVTTDERLRVTVQLIDGRTDYHRWSNSYERPLEDAIRLQHDLVNAIVREMGVAVTPDEANRLSRQESVEPSAYRAYLHGRFFWEQRTAAALQQSIPLFEQATALSPAYAEAYAGLADTYGLLPRYDTVDPRATLLESKRYALRALALDDGLAEAHTALAKTLYTLDWNWKEAGAHFDRAIDLNPSYATAYHWQSLYLMIVGRIDDALAAALKARDVDPVAIAVQSHAAWVRYLVGDAATAEREARAGIATAPRHAGNHELLGWIARSQGRFDESIAAFQAAVELEPREPRTRAALASARAAAGQPGDAVAMLKELESADASGSTPRELFVRLHTSLGNLDQAFAWLDRTADDRSISFFLFDLRYEPLYAPLRADPRLAALFRSLGLALTPPG